MAYIKRKQNGSYLVTVSCGRDSQDKKITRSTTFKPELLTAKGNPKTEKTLEKEVAAFAADFEKKVLTGAYTEGSVLSFEKFSQRYLEEYASIFQAPRTLQSTKAALKIFVTDFGYMHLEALTPLFLQTYTNNLYKQKKATGAPGTLSHGTIKRRMAVLSAMLSQAVRWNLIASNPMDRVQLKQLDIEPQEEKIRYFTQEEAKIFLTAIDDYLTAHEYATRHRIDNSGNVYPVNAYVLEHEVPLQMKLFFYLAMFSGARRGELIALEWTDFNFETAALNIYKSSYAADGEMITKTTKTKGSIRTITLPLSVIDLAKEWKAKQIERKTRVESQWVGKNYVFTQWNGRQMHIDSPYKVFKRIIQNYNDTKPSEAPKLPQIPLHGLRHTAATLLISQGIDIRTVAGRLGHSATSTTLNVYAHALNELDRAASNTLETILIQPQKHQ